VTIVHLPADAPSEKITEIIERDGCVVLDEVLDRATIDQLNRDFAPSLEAAPTYGDEFSGASTRRFGNLITLSPKAREVIMNQRVLETAAFALKHATTFQLHVTEVISIGPGESAQFIHRDQWAFDLFPFPQGHEATFATMWALSDFTADNGATRVIPGSHKLENELHFEHADTEPAEMKAGSVLLYLGSIYHGGGANCTESHRTGLIVHYCLGWLRQEENQYLSVPANILKTLPEDLLRLMGYSEGAFSLGFIDGGRDPIAAVRPEFERDTIDFEQVRKIEANFKKGIVPIPEKEGE
jgi:ectoine hydroxylase-related dioxygenase (phytanoyl-CoA dioxygenase family)